MRKLTVEAVRFSLIQVAVAAAVVYFYRVDDHAYLAAVNDKHALLEAQPSPRMIFVGGSNLAFSLNSPMVERDLPYRPVNLALHIGLGLRFLLNEVESVVRPGDVVVLSPEYQHFTHRRVEVLLQLLEQRPSSVRFVPTVYVPTLLDQSLNHMGSVVRGAIRNMVGRPDEPGDDPPYFRKAFNDHGDVVAHWRMKRPSKIGTFAFGDYSHRRILYTIGWLNEFHERARAQNVRVFFSYPTIPVTTLNEHRETIDEIDRAVRRSLTIPVLNRPEDAALPKEFFFDTHYHLTQAGATRRTRLLIESLRGVGLGGEVPDMGLSSAR
jgi:hypothetical protein